MIATAIVQTSAMYHAGQRNLQDRFDTRRLADRLAEAKVHDRLTEDDAAFIVARDMFFLATADSDGLPQCSYKGGDPGFVRPLDPVTLEFDSYDGNGMWLSLGNATVNPHVQMLFVDFEQTGQRMRVNGAATLHDPGSPRALLTVRIAVTEVIPNCPRYVHRMKLVERSRFVPRGDVEPPIPAWKTTDWARDVLPAGDPAIGATE